jgi:hypothetical protein
VDEQVGHKSSLKWKGTPVQNRVALVQDLSIRDFRAQCFSTGKIAFIIITTYHVSWLHCNIMGFSVVTNHFQGPESI